MRYSLELRKRKYMQVMAFYHLQGNLEINIVKNMVKN